MSDPVTLRLTGDCSLRTVRGRRDTLSAALATATCLDIDCTDADGIDMAFVQLIAASAKSAQRQSKRLRITHLPPAGRAAFARAGLTPPGLA